MADEIPFYIHLDYSTIKHVASKHAAKILNRCTDLSKITVNQPIKNVQRFLNSLKNSSHVAELEISIRDQRLLDLLPGECAVQKLVVRDLDDFQFLFKFRDNLISLVTYTCNTVLDDVGLIRQILEEFQLLSEFHFWHKWKTVVIEIENRERYMVTVGKETLAGDLDSAIQFITNSSQRRKKRKARELE